MHYFLDTADISEIIKWQDYIEGITTNPLLLEDFNDILKIEKIIKGDFIVFIQVHTWDEVLKIRKLSRQTTLQLVLKVPLVYPWGYDLLRKIKESKVYLKTCGTVTYDLIQLHQALGCNYCIVLIAKNDNPNFLEEAVKIKNLYHSSTQLIGASFRTKNDIKRAMLSGVHYITVPPKIMELAFKNSQADADVKHYLALRGIND